VDRGRVGCTWPKPCVRSHELKQTRSRQWEFWGTRGMLQLIVTGLGKE
jgi:hypothetical protein